MYISATDLNRRSGEILDMVGDGEVIVIIRHNSPYAIIRKFEPDDAVLVDWIPLRVEGEAEKHSGT